MDSKPDIRKPIKVTIFNQTYTLTSQGDPSDAGRGRREVDDLMHSIAERAGSSDASRVAVLACLHMADRMRALEAITRPGQPSRRRIFRLLEQVFQPE